MVCKDRETERKRQEGREGERVREGAGTVFKSVL